MRTKVLALALIPLALPFRAAADLNAWTNVSSGNWQDACWSLGSLPTNGQYVAITNEGWKAVAINPDTTQNYASNLAVYSVDIASPANSSNVLLMNYAGLKVPLSTRLMTVASNSSVSMLYSALHLSGGLGEGLSIGGEFDQDVSSIVTGPQMDIGWLGPGVYNLRNGTVSLTGLWLGGSFGGQFNQYDGSSCHAGTLYLYPNGAYNYYGGNEAPTNIYWEGGTFFQRGGIRTWPTIGGYYVQTGGTNYGTIGFGAGGRGIYTLSNGVSVIPDLPVAANGGYEQWGGTQSVAGLVTVGFYLGGFRSPSLTGVVSINGGDFEAGAISLTGYYHQTGGTSVIHGDISLQGAVSTLRLDGGTLMDQNVTVNPGYEGLALVQYGGVHVIASQLTIIGAPYTWTYYGALLCPGAQMVVSNISLSNLGALVLAGGTIEQSGLLKSFSGYIFTGEGTSHFGAFQMQSTSWLTLPLNTNSIVRFNDSEALPWGGQLVISNWCGALEGGGLHQVFFGHGPGALTAEQLSQIAFSNPLGLSPGMYPAKMLSTGEVVPTLGPGLRLTRQADGSVMVNLAGEDGFLYWIETSRDLTNWSYVGGQSWSDAIATNGTLSVLDKDTTNTAQKFYRAVQAYGYAP